MNEINIQKTLDILNNKSNKTVLECIDRPIRPLIHELHRIGLKTKFSCCGFTYTDETEPKSHANYPFIVINPFMYKKNNQEYLETNVVASFLRLANISCGLNWRLTPYNQNGEWHLSKPDSSQASKFYRKQDHLIHAYEDNLLSIQRLQKQLKKLPTIVNQFKIIDGNTNYNEMTNGEWQVKPANPIMFKVTKNGYERI